MLTKLKMPEFLPALFHLLYSQFAATRTAFPTVAGATFSFLILVSQIEIASQ